MMRRLVPVRERWGTGAYLASGDLAYLIPGLPPGTHPLREVWRWKGKQGIVGTVVVGVT